MDAPNETRVSSHGDALVQDDGVGPIVGSELDDVGVRKRDREELEPRLLDEEAHECPLQGGRDGDEDPEWRVRPYSQTRVLG